VNSPLNLIKLGPGDWSSLAKILDDEQTGRFLCQWFPGFTMDAPACAKAMLELDVVLATPERDVVVLFEPHPLGHVIHILAMPDARHGKALRVLEEAIAWGFTVEEWYRLLAVAPVDHPAALKLGLKAGMKMLHRANGWETHYLDYLTWLTTSPLLQRLGGPGLGTRDSAHALAGVSELVSPGHPLNEVVREILGGFGALLAQKTEA
jgi:hypothetical protein